MSLWCVLITILDRLFTERLAATCICRVSMWGSPFQCYRERWQRIWPGLPSRAPQSHGGPTPFRFQRLRLRRPCELWGIWCNNACHQLTFAHICTGSNVRKRYKLCALHSGCDAFNLVFVHFVCVSKRSLRTGRILETLILCTELLCWKEEHFSPSGYDKHVCGDSRSRHQYLNPLLCDVCIYGGLEVFQPMRSGNLD